MGGITMFGRLNGSEFSFELSDGSRNGDFSVYRNWADVPYIENGLEKLCFFSRRCVILLIFDL